jgi:hypothetical protein
MLSRWLSEVAAGSGRRKWLPEFEVIFAFAIKQVTQFFF